MKRVSRGRAPRAEYMSSEAYPLALIAASEAVGWEIESQAGRSRSEAELSWELVGHLRAACVVADEIAESSRPDEKCVYEGMASQLKEWAANVAATAAADECRARDGRIRQRLESPQEDPAPQLPAPRACLDLDEWEWGRSGRRVRPGAGHRAERREPSWEHEELSRMLSKVLRHHPVTDIRDDGAALLDDLIRALRQEHRWRELDASSVEEVVRRSLHDGCPRFEFLEDNQGRRMIRATRKHTFEKSAGEWQEEMVSRALVHYCRGDKWGGWVKEAELVDVAKKVDASVDQRAVLSILQSAKHNWDHRLRFEEWKKGSERWFKATRTSKRSRHQTKP